ncbi:MAG: hypothetical protein V1821_03255 [bacterium]
MSPEIKYIEVPNAQGLVKTTAQELGNARSQETLDALTRKALGVIQLPEGGAKAFILPKARLYSGLPGMDNMIFVAKEDQSVESIEQLDKADLQYLLTAAQGLQNIYREHEDEKHPITLNAVAINYRSNPLPEQILNRKLHAQSLRNLHVHVTAFSEKDVKTQSNPEERVPKRTRDNLRDPGLVIFNYLLKSKRAKELVIKDCETLTVEDAGSYPGITCKTEARLENIALSKDLIQLHENAQRLYETISNLFIDPSKTDKNGMPLPRSTKDQEHQIKEFAQTVFGSEDALIAERFINILKRFGRLLKKSSETAPDERVFLRGFAYTLGIIKKPEEENLRIVLTPRILSTGNISASLIGSAVPSKTPPEQSWLREREAVFQDIRSAFSEEKQRKATPLEPEARVSP